MPLDPQAEAFLRQLAALNLPPLAQQTVEQARAQFSPAPLPLAEVAQVQNRLIPGAGGEIPVRIYTPAEAPANGSSAWPLLVYFHGGGWVLGSLDSHDGLCRDLANAAGAVVVSVDYRLAPEHKYPAAAEDAYSATCWAYENAAELQGDRSRLIVCGDGAGGNLAAAVCLMARDRGSAAVALQVLFYPVTNCDCDTPSYREFSQGYLLARADMQWFLEQYLAQADDARQPYAAPLLASDLTGLPPACILTAECDVLRDEAEAYAARLQAAGIHVELRRCEGMIHGFLRRTDVFDRARETMQWIGDYVRRTSPISGLVSGRWRIGGGS